MSHQFNRLVALPRHLGVALLVMLTCQSFPRAAQADWWGKSVSKMDVRSITLGMSMEEVAKLHPELRLQPGNTWQIVGGQKITFDPGIIEREMTDGGFCGQECFSVGFASSKEGGGVDNLYLLQTLPSGANVSISDLLADMEKKYGSPTDLQKNADVADYTSTITASWGMGIDASSPEENPQSGQVLKVELKNDDGTVQVSFFLEDFGMQAADAKLMRDFMAQVTRQQADQANKTLNY
ncbi:MAG: hypothetical protein P4L52_03385 [Acidocella sp.]|nr:hypothetical protein [Acidocella sp.]